VLDIVDRVGADSDKRDVSLPIWDDRYSWWTNAVLAKLRPEARTGPTQKDLADKLGMSTSKVSRAISREKPLYDAVIAISDELGVPRPVLLPESLDEAVDLGKHSKLIRSDRQRAEVEVSPPRPKKSVSRENAKSRRATPDPRRGA